MRSNRQSASTLVFGVVLMSFVVFAVGMAGAKPVAAHPAGGLGAEMRSALAAAPLEQRGACARTVEVRGLGAACRTVDGLFRIPGAHGEDLTTHGADAAPVESASYSAASSAAVKAAGPHNVECVGTGSSVKHTTLVYSYPADRVNRSETIRPLLIQEAYRASAFVDSESRSVNAARGFELVFECDSSGVPVVRVAQLPTSSASDTFSSVVADLKAQGFGPRNERSASDRHLVFHDGTVASGAAGTGHLFRDNRASADNASNNGGMFAVEFAWSGTPHWAVLLHEAGHNMGAVQASAPHATQYGHCNDGSDVMCYADGSSDSAYSSSVCATEVFDCRRNDYFHPSPPAGSYLATHWNVAHVNNMYGRQVAIDAIATTTSTTTAPTADTSAPSAVAEVRIVAVAPTIIRLGWNAATDDQGVVGYRVDRYDAAAARWIVLGTTTDRTYAARGLKPLVRYALRVSAVDAAGNRSPFANVTATTSRDSTAPLKVPSVRVAARATAAGTIAWGRTSDNVAVTRYVVERYGAGTWHQIATLAPTARSFRQEGITPGRSYSYRLRARDAAGNVAPASLRTVLAT